MANYKIKDIEIVGLISAVPDNTVTSDKLIEKFANIRNKKQYNTTQIAFENQTSSDLGFIAASNLIEIKNINKDEIGFIIFISRTPDYRSPATAIVLQHRLGISKDCIAYDINIGSMGFIQGLQLGSSLLSNLSKKIGLLVIGDTISKQLAYNDPEIMNYGDGCTALILEKKNLASEINIQLNSDGSKFRSFFLPDGGFRGQSKQSNLVINRDDILDLSRAKVPEMLLDYIEENKLSLDKYDLFAIQQYDIQVLTEVTKKLNYDLNELPINFSTFGNTSGCSIPLLLADYIDNQNHKEYKILACAFGEGLSWGFADFTIQSKNIFPTIFSNEYFLNGFVTHEM